MFDRSLTLDRVDPEVWAAVQKEDQRQEQHIELIASENYASPAVMQALSLIHISEPTRPY